MNNDNGIQAANYQVAGNLLVGGVPTPWYDMKVDMNVYSMASMIEAHGPFLPLDGTVSTSITDYPDYGAMTQAGLVPLSMQVGIVGVSGSTSTQLPIQMITLEQGYLDEYTDRPHANEVEFIGRSTASIFQVTRLATATFPQYKNVRGDQLASMLFAKHGIPLVVGAQSPSAYYGKSYTEEEYVRAYKARSEWDEMTDAALNDGYVLYVHAGKGYYGPPAQSSPTATISWGKDLLECSVNHAARRSHNIAVRVDSNGLTTEQHYTATYPAAGANSDTTQTFRKFVAGLDQAGCRAKAFAIYQDLVSHEFIGTLKLVPDTDFLRILAQYGANFLIQLEGMRASANILYHVRQAVITVDAGDDENPTLTVDIVMANHDPQFDAGSDY